MKIENIFLEFMSLYYNNVGTKPDSLKDISLSSGIIARYTDIGCTIYYLTTGNYIRIPWNIMDLFLSLNTYSGNRIIYERAENAIELFIQLGVKFVNSIDNNSSQDTIAIFSEILELGTKNFRKWYIDRFNRDLGMIEFFSPDKNFEI